MCSSLKLPDGSARARAAAALVDRLAQFPGVQAAGGSTGLPTVTPQRNTRFEIEGRSLDGDDEFAYFIAASPGNFTALGAPIRRGRQFEAGDTATGLPVAVVNETLANRLFPGQDPIGKRIRLINPEYANDWRTIVGVVGDVKYRGLDRDAQPDAVHAVRADAVPVAVHDGPDDRRAGGTRRLHPQRRVQRRSGAARLSPCGR